MLIFGVNIPLIELMFLFSIILLLVLIEGIIIISLLVKELNKSKEVGQLLQKLSNTLLEIKKAEIEELDKIRGARKR